MGGTLTSQRCHNIQGFRDFLKVKPFPWDRFDIARGESDQLAVPMTKVKVPNLSFSAIIR